MLKRISKIIFVRIPIWFLILSISWVLLYRVIPVKWTPLMLKRTIENIDKQNYQNNQTWVNLEDIAPVMVRAVIASEDGRFMEHRGFDILELKKMKKEHETKGKKIRGCSTISQQVATNCLTFCGHSWWTKGVETYIPC